MVRPRAWSRSRAYADRGDFLALIGVAGGLIWNGYIAKRERKAKILHDKQSLRFSLLEELEKLKESMEFRDTDLGKALNDVYALSSDPLTSLFKRIDQQNSV
jgi:hypothetical protein